MAYLGSYAFGRGYEVKQAVVDSLVAAGGTAIAAVTGKRIAVVQMAIGTDTANGSAIFRSASAAGAVLSAEYFLQAIRSSIFPAGTFPYFVTNVGELLHVVVGQTFSGHFWYIEADA